ncbi:MAG: hypothetical protein WCO56_10945 [Verrucomicrobiota bacterium]
MKMVMTWLVGLLIAVGSFLFQTPSAVAAPAKTCACAGCQCGGHCGCSADQPKAPANPVTPPSFNGIQRLDWVGLAAVPVQRSLPPSHIVAYAAGQTVIRESLCAVPIFQRNCSFLI